VRLRTLTEAECYARCYGGRREERVSILRFGFPEKDEADRSGERFAATGSEPTEAREAA
jgi:hypothetical protein